MNYTYPPEEYMKLLNAYMELDKLTFSPDTDKETVLKKLKEVSDYTIPDSV